MFTFFYATLNHHWKWHTKYLSFGVHHLSHISHAEVKFALQCGLLPVRLNAPWPSDSSVHQAWVIGIIPRYHVKFKGRLHGLVSTPAKILKKKIKRVKKNLNEKFKEFWPPERQYTPLDLIKGQGQACYKWKEYGILQPKSYRHSLLGCLKL